MPPTRRLQFNLRMGPAAGKNHGKVLYRTWVNCDDMGVPFLCSVDKCEESVLDDCWFCTRHLREKCGVYIAPSRTGFGKGLFTAKAFKRGQRIAHYGGEIISAQEMDNRYGWMLDDEDEYVVVTAPYALSLNDTENARDAVRIRGAGSYCNSPKGFNIKCNASLGNRFVRATTTIHPDTEIFVSYGCEYWGCAGPDISTHETILRVDDIPDVPCKRRKMDE
jgi:hypothetical protein